MHSWHGALGPDRVQDVCLKKGRYKKMKKNEEINAGNKAIDEYYSRRNRLFGKAISFAYSVKLALDVARPDEHGDVKIFSGSVERLKAMAAEIDKDDDELQSEFERIFIEGVENG